ncbi:putative MFS transporter [Amniculicola lignicola CBS 123094]|uniref:Putative MFS transporter n=1 Tax=Amniculicola lignicola CBS 123094 TaxID=1392246 RepID=A0A6A5X528_9PLEO|nr:putative MFS transporter [Amniculicola lignicola CBS 123094]
MAVDEENSTPVSRMASTDEEKHPHGYDTPDHFAGLSVQTTPPGVPPEEGLGGWLCVAGSFSALLATFGFLNAMGVFQNTYATSILRTYTHFDIGWIFAFQLAAMWIPGPLFGRIIDSYGPVPVLWPCSILCVFSLCMTSLSDKYYQIFLSQGVGFGIGAGGVFTVATVCTGQWFVKRRGLAVGITTAGSSFGGVIFPIFFYHVQEDVGFHGAVRYTALFIGILLFISCCLIKSRLPKKKWNSKLPWLDVSLFKNPAFALYTAGSFFVMWGLFGPFDFLLYMGRKRGFSYPMAVYLVSILNASSILGRILPPHLGDRYGYFNVQTLVTFLSGLTIAALWIPFNYVWSHAGLIVFAVAYGFFSGGFIGLLMPCVAKAGTIETLGVRFGTFQPVMGLSTLTGLPIMGQILNTQRTTNFIGLQSFAMASILVGSLLTAAATVMLRRSRGTPFV